MNNKLDLETLKIPAYMRKKMIVSQSRQKLILTALDRKQAHLPHNSKVALARDKDTVVAPARRQTLSPSPARISRSSMSGIVEMPRKKFPQIGHVTHYLEKINVAIIMLSAALKQDDLILIEGENELFVQKVEEMQIDRQPVTKAKKGSHIGLKTCEPAIIEGKIYRISP